MTTGTAGTGASTPNRKAENISILSQSRPASPLSIPPAVTNNDATVLSAALQKKIARKRKIVDNEVCLNMFIFNLDNLTLIKLYTYRVGFSRFTYTDSTPDWFNGYAT